MEGCECIRSRVTHKTFVTTSPNSNDAPSPSVCLLLKAGLFEGVGWEVVYNARELMLFPQGAPSLRVQPRNGTQHLLYAQFPNGVHRVNTFGGWFMMRAAAKVYIFGLGKSFVEGMEQSVCE